jgi:hypothetical protein
VSAGIAGVTGGAAVLQNVRDSTLPALKTAAEISESIAGMISAERIHELAEAGYMPCWRIDGGTPMYQSNDVKRWIKQNLMHAHQGAPFPSLAVVAHDDDKADIDTAPECLMALWDHLREYRHVWFPPAVYFLVKGKSVVYVGQSVGLPGRIQNHVQGKEFDRVFYVAVPRRDLDAVEAAFIRVLRPPLNGTHNGPAVEASDADRRLIARYTDQAARIAAVVPLTGDAE